MGLVDLNPWSMFALGAYLLRKKEVAIFIVCTFDKLVLSVSAVSQ